MQADRPYSPNILLDSSLTLSLTEKELTFICLQVLVQLIPIFI